jgi:hypothetical protein
MAFLIGSLLTGGLVLAASLWGFRAGFDTAVRHQRQLTSRTRTDVLDHEIARARQAQDAIDYLYGRARTAILGLSHGDESDRRWP